MKDEQLYLIRTVGNHHYYKGSGMFAVPKLYQIGAAKRVVRKENKFGQGVNNNPAYDGLPRLRGVEAVPVTFVLGNPVTFEE